MDETEERIRQLVKLMSYEKNPSRMAALAEELERVISKKKLILPKIEKPRSS